MDSSISNPHDSSTSTSAGTCSPALSHKTSPSTISLCAISIFSPPLRTIARAAINIESLSKVRFAFNSVTMPIPVFIRITAPKTASFHEPVASTTTIAVKIIALNNVNTFARTISIKEREVCLEVIFTSPRETASATSSSLNPEISTSGSAATALFLPSTVDTIAFCLLLTIYDHFPTVWRIVDYCANNAEQRRALNCGIIWRGIIWRGIVRRRIVRR